MYGPPWGNKPPPGTPLAENSLTNGLIFFAPLWECSGPTIHDIVGGLTLPITGTMPWASGLFPGVSMTTGTAYAQTLAPAYLQISQPWTVACGFRQIAAPANSHFSFFGVSSNGTFASPYFGYGLGYLNSSAGAITYSAGSGIGNTPSFTIPAAGTDNVWAGTLQAGGTTPLLAYANGINVGFYNTSSFPTYGSNPVIGFNWSQAAHAANILPYWGAIWNRALSPAENAAIANNPWLLFAPPPAYWLYKRAASTSGSYLPSSHIISDLSYASFQEE